jgi:HEAT repeat-containing protein 5
MAYERSGGSLPNPELDITKLQSLPPEQQELYLLTFTSDLVRHVSSLDADGASAHQIYLKKELFQIISLPSPPTRVIRNNIGKCFAGIFGKGDRKLLFDSINELLGIVNAGKGEKDLRVKHAAVYCLGETFGAAGDSAISLSSVTCASLLKLLKPAQIHAGLRSSVFRALGKLFETVGSSADESVARDVWKQARNAASSDKAAVVQISAIKCLENLTRETTYFDNMSDFDSLKSTLFKSLDSTTPPIRHAAASCLASTLVKSFSEDASREAPVRAKRPKKTNRRQSMAPGDDEEVQRPESPVARKPAMQLSLNLNDLLRQLSAQYVRTSTTNRVRAGIAVCYTRVLKGLAGEVVETQYSKIMDHLLVDLLSHPNLIINRYRVLTTRKFVRVILEDVVGRQILGETGQLNAAKVLVNDVLKNYPQVIKERPEPSKHTLNGALSALSSLIGSLGSATNSIADSTRDGLLQVLQHPSYTVQVSTSHCLRAFVLACPQQLLPCVSICMNSVSRELNLLKTPRHSPRRCVGYANGLAAVLSTAPLQPLYGSVDVNSRVLSLATGLLKSSGNHELRVSGTEIQVAWILIGGLMSLGPNFVKIHLSQLLLLWKNALPKPLAKDSMVQRSALELSFLTHVRECALGSVLAFFEFNSRLLTTDVSKRIAAMLQNTTLFLNSLPSKKTTEDVSQRLSPSLQLQDLDLMVRRRVLQCYVKLVNLSPSGGGEILLQSNLLTLAVSFFADPDNYSPSSLSTSIASSAGTFETVWDVGDNYGFGITGLVRGLEIKRLPGEHTGGAQNHWPTRRGPDDEIDQTVLPL